MSDIDGYSSSNLNKYQCGQSFAVHRIGAFSERLFEMVSQVDHARILNLGCGEGFDMNKLFRDRPIQFDFGCGLDSNINSLMYSRKLLADFEFHPINGDIEHLPVKLDSFDLILCLEVLEHLDDPDQVLREISHRFNGHCLFSVPNEPLYRLTRMFLLRKNIRQLGNHPEHLKNWSKRAFCLFVGRYFVLDSVLTTFPWTIVLCHKG